MVGWPFSFCGVLSVVHTHLYHNVFSESFAIAVLLTQTFEKRITNSKIKQAEIQFPLNGFLFSLFIDISNKRSVPFVMSPHDIQAICNCRSFNSDG
jgi:hypothetical protein